GGELTNTFGASILVPGTKNFSKVMGSLSYNDHSGLSSGVSYNFGDGTRPSTPGEPSQQDAQNNLLNYIFNGVGAMVSGIGRGVKSVWNGVFGGGAMAGDGYGAPSLNNPVQYRESSGTFGPNGKPIDSEEKILQDLIIKDRGSKEGIIGELIAKGELGLLTSIEKDKLYKLISAKETMNHYDQLMLNENVDFDSLSPQAKAEYLKSAKLYLDAERIHSQGVLSNWKSEGLKDIPLTPYAKSLLTAQLPGVDLDAIRLTKPGEIQKALLKILTFGQASSVTIGNTVYNLSNGASSDPAGYNQVDNTHLKAMNTLSHLAHEITHTGQQNNSFLGKIGFALRYVPEQIKDMIGNSSVIQKTLGFFGLSINRTYTTTPFTGAVPNSVIGMENNYFYNGNYTGYDNYADMNRDIMKERISRIYNGF
ncbi:hypothetical protein, partial [Leptospira gomenensis]